MDENTINRTKAAINALIDIEQLWIENTPNYNLSIQELLVLKKRLERASENVSRIYEDNKVKMQAAEEEIKKMHVGKKEIMNESIYREKIKVGLNVGIVLKQDQRSGKITRGIVKRVLTNSSYHPHGIKVELEDGKVGRVKEIH
jgi:uncharacterized repeat protein (TIGR03833 family)